MNLRKVCRYLSIIVALTVGGAISTVRADDRSEVEALVPQIEAQLDPAFLSAAKQHLAAEPDKGVEPMMGMVMMLQGKPLPAAWFFAQDVMSHPENAAALNNLGVALQAAAGDPAASADPEWVDAGFALVSSAREVDPDNAIVGANYGQALLDQWRQGSNTVGLENAVAALRQSIDQDPDNPFARAHLAEVLLAMDETEAARKAFNEAQSRWSMHPAVIAAALRSPGITGAGNSSPMPQCDNLDVVKMCQETCACESIVGCLNFVTCAMSNSDFIDACRAGQPFPTAYNCEADFPQFGIQIPGLQSGFSIIAPGVSIQVGPDGKGGYKWEVKAGPNAYVKVGGSLDPKTGAVRGVNVATGVGITMVPGEGQLGEIMGKYGINPGTVAVETDPKKPIKVGAWEDAKDFFVQM
jgi:Tetratricopeptide repeat